MVVGYAFSPIDLIPDFVPVLGYLDDLVLVPAGVALALKMVPKGILDECRQRARDATAEGKPTNWAVAGAIVLVWVLCLGLLALGVARAIDRG